jgi:hypothetical protein
VAHPIRNILAFRAGGVLVIGLALPGAFNRLGAVLADPNILNLRYGHHAAVLGILDTFLNAIGSSEGLQMLWQVGLVGTGIAMLTIRADRAHRIFRRLDRT